MTTVKSVAIKEKSGKVVKAKGKSHSHAQLSRKENVKSSSVQHDFVLSNGKIVNRSEAMKVAKKSGQVSEKAGSKLYSAELRKSAKTKLKPL